MESATVYAFVLTTIVSNILTFQSFKYYRKPLTKDGNSSTETFMVYPLVSLFIVLYSMLFLISAKWSVDVANTTFDFDKARIVKIISEALQTTFQSAIRMIPFTLFIGLVNSVFGKTMIFDANGKFSPYYLAFAFLLNMYLSFLYRNDQIQFTEQGIISAFIVLVITISLIKVNTPTVNTGNATNFIDRLITSTLNLFLNFNVKLLYVLMPFVLFFTLGFIALTDTSTEKLLQVAAIFFVVVIALILFALMHSAIKKHKNSRSGKEFAKTMSTFYQALTTIVNPAILRPLLKTALYLSVYSVPLASYIYFTSNDFEIFKEKYIATFNRQFLEIIAASYVVMSILQKFITIKQEQINKLISLQLLIALVVSRGNS